MNVFVVVTCSPAPAPPAAIVRWMFRVLLLDDDAPFRAALKRMLDSPKMVVEGHATVDAFSKAVRMQRHHLLLVDWNLQTALGTGVCEDLRAGGETRPIAIISGLLDIRFARQLATGAGASDFIDKASSIEEWRARVASLVEGPRYPTGSLASGIHRLDARVRAARSVELRDGAAILYAHRVALRPLEYETLEYLLAHVDTVVSSQALIVAVWNEEPSRTGEGLAAQRARVTTTMNRLRKALGEAGTMIESVRGGYVVHSAVARAQGG